MENRKRRITLELEGKYLERIEDLSRKNFRQLREQIMAILHNELIQKGEMKVETKEKERA